MKKLLKLTLALSIFATTVSVTTSEATFEGDVEVVSTNTDYTGVLNTTYSTELNTNQDVVVTVVLEDANYKFLNNTGVETVSNTEVKITFTESKTVSGSIEHVTNNGEIYTYSVTVDWINKTTPTANFTKVAVDNTVTYTLDATSTGSDDVVKNHTVTNNGGSFTYTFTENGIFTFEFVDQFGNVGTTTIIENSIVDVNDEIIDGANQTVDVSKVDYVELTSNAEFADFESIWFDGKELSSEFYTVSQGSIIVRISSLYLNTLLDGTYDVAVHSKTGVASTKVVLVNTVLSLLGADLDESKEEVVTPTITSPHTGVNMNGFVLLSLNAVGIAGLYLTRKKD